MVGVTIVVGSQQNPTDVHQRHPYTKEQVQVVLSLFFSYSLPLSLFLGEGSCWHLIFQKGSRFNSPVIVSHLVVVSHLLQLRD